MSGNRGKHLLIDFVRSSIFRIEVYVIVEKY